MIIRGAVLLSIVLFVLNIFAAPVTLVGTAKGYVGKEIELQFYGDLFTRETRTIQALEIDEDGQFGFKFEVNQTRLVSLHVDNYYTSFYVVPGADYAFTLSNFDPATAPPLSDKKFLPVSFQVEDPSKVNALIRELNSDIENFELNNYLAFLQSKAKPIVIEFEKSILKKEKYGEQAFVLEYLKYSIARLKSLARFKQQELYANYLEGKGIQYQNPAFVSFFDTFYAKWFRRYEVSREYGKIVNAINISQSADTLFDFLSKNDFLKNREILEIVALEELHREGVKNKTFKSERVAKLIREIETSTEFREVRDIANYYLRKLVQLAAGNPAPDLKFLDKAGKGRKLSEFKGKYVYLDFWATWCQPCVRSMGVMDKLYPKYKDKVEFVSISVDEKQKRFDRFVEKNNYPWTFGYIGENEKAKSTYGVVAMPLYYLIDPEGNLVQSPAFSPGNGIELYFKQLFEERKKKKIEVWDWKKKLKKSGDKD